MMKLKTWVAALGLAASAGVSQAALVSLGDGTVKDTNTNLIWLADWSAGPVHMWAEVNAWAQGLNFAGSSDWVLPSTQQFVDLYAAYGDLTAVSQFTNVIVSDYWTSTGQSPMNKDTISTSSGNVYSRLEYFLSYSVAVHPESSANAVPEPQTLALALLALGAAAAARGRRAR